MLRWTCQGYVQGSMAERWSEAREREVSGQEVDSKNLDIIWTMPKGGQTRIWTHRRVRSKHRLWEATHSIILLRSFSPARALLVSHREIFDDPLKHWMPALPASARQNRGRSIVDTSIHPIAKQLYTMYYGSFLRKQFFVGIPWKLEAFVQVEAFCWCNPTLLRQH